MLKLQDYVTYRGNKSGHWAWVFHRLTGLGVLVFLFLHILDTAMIGWGPAVYNDVISIYRQPFFRVGEAILVGAVLYHALNGVRIVLIDFWPPAMRTNRKLIYAVVIVFIVVYIPTAIYMLRFML